MVIIFIFYAKLHWLRTFSNGTRDISCLQFQQQMDDGTMYVIMCVHFAATANADLQ